MSERPGLHDRWRFRPIDSGLGGYSAHRAAVGWVNRFSSSRRRADDEPLDPAQRSGSVPHRLHRRSHAIVGQHLPARHDVGSDSDLRRPGPMAHRGARPMHPSRPLSPTKRREREKSRALCAPERCRAVRAGTLPRCARQRNGPDQPNAPASASHQRLTRGARPPRRRHAARPTRNAPISSPPRRSSAARTVATKKTACVAGPHATGADRMGLLEPRPAALGRTRTPRNR